MFNVEKYIRTCLDSVLGQTLQDFEVLCVDDGCTDNTVNIVLSYDDSRIKLISQTNRGLAAARNTGINASVSPFIALLDADDYWHPEKLKMHFNHLCSNPGLGISYSQSRFIDAKGGILPIGQHPKLNCIKREDVLCRNPIGNGSAPVIRRDALLDVARKRDNYDEHQLQYFDERLRQSEDIELWLRIILNTSWRFEGIGRELTYYRINSSGLSADLKKQFYSWRIAMEMNYKGHELFFEKWLSLAEAYQKRYLARRAIQSNQSITAIALLIQALSTNSKILVQEPFKTVTTSVCALLSFMPFALYKTIENTAMKMIQPKRA